MSNQLQNPDFRDYRRASARDNRLWLLAFIAVLVLTSFLIWMLGKSEQQIRTQGEMGGNAPRLPAFAAQGHQEAADQIKVRIQSVGVSRADVRFVDRDQLVIELPSGIDRALVPEVISIAKQISQEKLKITPVLAVYLAKEPGRGYRTPANVE